MEKRIVKFAYSGSGRREFFDHEFEVKDEKDLQEQIKDYVERQNRGEAKSDRIRYWSTSPATQLSTS